MRLAVMRADIGFFGAIPAVDTRPPPMDFMSRIKWKFTGTVAIIMGCRAFAEHVSSRGDGQDYREDRISLFNNNNKFASAIM